jgi:hypothetical protein
MDHTARIVDMPQEPSRETPPAAYSDADLVERIRDRESVMRRALAEQLGLIAEAERRGLYGDTMAAAASPNVSPLRGGARRRNGSQDRSSPR